MLSVPNIVRHPIPQTSAAKLRSHSIIDKDVNLYLNGIDRSNIKQIKSNIIKIFNLTKQLNLNLEFLNLKDLQELSESSNCCLWWSGHHHQGISHYPDNSKALSELYQLVKGINSQFDGVFLSDIRIHLRG